MQSMSTESLREAFANIREGQRITIQFATVNRKGETIRNRPHSVTGVVTSSSQNLLYFSTRKRNTFNPTGYITDLSQIASITVR